MSQWADELAHQPMSRRAIKLNGRSSSRVDTMAPYASASSPASGALELRKQEQLGPAWSPMERNGSLPVACVHLCIGSA